MGVTYSLIIGESDTVASLHPFHMPESDAIITKVLDPVTFAQLHAIVMRCAYGDVVNIYLENPVHVLDPDHEWFWVYEVPSAFVTRLANLPDDEVARVALAFGHTEEMNWVKLNWNLTDAWIHNLLTGIRTLCNRAIQQNQQVFLFCML
jgi:hypothetical protein